MHNFVELYRRKRVAIGSVMLALSWVLFFGGCKQKPDAGKVEKPAGITETITICHGSVADILPRIAFENRYFENEGLTVNLKDMSDGKLAFEDMLKGECNFAVNGEPPIVLHGVENANFVIVATVMSDDDPAKIIARRDRGVTHPQDLRGKRIGVKKGIIGHLFLDLFMMKHGLAPQDLTMVDMASDQLLPSLMSGEIDGFSMTNKMVNTGVKVLGEKAIVFGEPGLNIIFGILTTRKDIPLNLEATPRVLNALIHAENFVNNDPAAAKAILTRYYNYSEQEIADVWARTTIEVSLPNTLFVRLEDQYRWQVERGFAKPELQFPNYLTIVAPKYLSAIKPDSVSVVK